MKMHMDNNKDKMHFQTSAKKKPKLGYLPGFVREESYCYLLPESADHSRYTELSQKQ